MSQFVEVTRKGLGSRGKDSLGGLFVGFIFLAIAVAVLFYNEGRAVKRYKDLKEGAGSVVSIPSTAIDPAMEGKLIHTSGNTVVSTPLQDAEFGISVPAIKLIRTAEMFQWVEKVKTKKKENVGGSTEETKTYSYETAWKSNLVDSSQFKVSSEYRNPKEMKYLSTTMIAEGVTLGNFDLPAFLVAKIGGATPLVIENLKDASPEIQQGAKIQADEVYFGTNPSSPVVGDQRIRFETVLTGPVSVVARQTGKTFTPFPTSTKGHLDLLEAGIVSAPEMFQKAKDRNKVWTWAIRVGGFVFMTIAFAMILRPIAVLASILPFLGRIVGTGTGILGFLLAGILWTITVAVAWIFYRPVLGITILVVTLVLIILAVKRLRKGSAIAPPLVDAPPPLL
jgi:hypothetical protein